MINDKVYLIGTTSAAAQHSRLSAFVYKIKLGYPFWSTVSHTCSFKLLSFTLSWILSQGIFSAFFILLPVLFTLRPVLGLTECHFPALFNFGDSNSDTRGLAAAFGQAPPPNGESYFGKPAGRYSDGRLIVDFIAKGIGLPYINGYLDSIGTNFTHGANFATAASTIREPTSSLFQGGVSPFSLDVQSWQFDQFMNRSQTTVKKGGVFKDLLPKEDYFPRALYTYDIGQNDSTSGFSSGLTEDEVIATIPDILNKFTTAVENIYWQGGRLFWIHNTCPFGCLPYVLDRLLVKAAEVDPVGCATPFNDVAQQFNHKLKETVDQLRNDFPLAAFTYVDIYSAKYSLIHQAGKYGFDHPLRACCGYGGTYNYNQQVGCGGTIVVNGTDILVTSCQNPSTRINWDGVHYTEAANKWVFDQIVNGALSDPPIPLKKACHREAH